MSDKAMLKSYQPVSTNLVGNSYQPTPSAGASSTPKAVIPPKGGTGARTLHLKPVSTTAGKK